jgi:1-deoxy-D-xylulose-5-phosphate synthase
MIAFNTGHSSTSISAALGFAKARDIKNENIQLLQL